MKEYHYDLIGDPQIKKELLEESNNAGWVEIYKDDVYRIEQDKFTKLYRHRMTDPTISGSQRFNGIPNGYFVSQRTGEVMKNPGASPIAPSQEVTEVPFIDSNPKTAFGAVKPGTFQTPPMPLYEYSLAHYQGALKYGHYNWRKDAVSISTYINAARRHIDLFVEGQKDAADTGIHNLAHAMTCLSIIIDAEWYGTLLDDRGAMGIRGHDKLEEYFNASKERVTKITKDWSGHAEQLKAKLNEAKSTG